MLHCLSEPIFTHKCENIFFKKFTHRRILIFSYMEIIQYCSKPVSTCIFGYFELYGVDIFPHDGKSTIVLAIGGRTDVSFHLCF